MKTLILSPDSAGIAHAAQLLRQDEVVALPTETVYGLAGNATKEATTLKIFEAKERPTFDPLIVHVSETLLQHSAGPLEALVEQGIIHPRVLSWEFIEKLETTLTRFWPGPLTLVLPRGNRIPDTVTSGQDTVAIRMPAHPVFQSVLNRLDFPLAAPSANRFGRISPTTSHHVQTELDGRIAAILDGGPCTVGLESSIFSVQDPLKVELLRPGKIPASDLASIFGVSIQQKKALGEENQSQLAPGMLEQHYAPRKPLLLLKAPLTNAEDIRSILNQHSFIGNTAFLTQKPLPSQLRSMLGGIHLPLSRDGDPSECARNLFSKMRELDENEKVAFLIADLPEHYESGIEAAIADRLNRASINKPLLKV